MEEKQKGKKRAEGRERLCLVQTAISDTPLGARELLVAYTAREQLSKKIIEIEMSIIQSGLIEDATLCFVLC